MSLYGEPRIEPAEPGDPVQPAEHLDLMQPGDDPGDVLDALQEAAGLDLDSARDHPDPTAPDTPTDGGEPATGRAVATDLPEIPDLPPGATFDEAMAHSRHWVAHLVGEIREHAGFDEEAFRELALGVQERTRDPELDSAIWDYREGRMVARQLRALPAFRDERNRWLAERAAQLRREHDGV